MSANTGHFEDGNLLSEELLEALGGDGDVILTKKRKQSDKDKSDSIPEELMENAKKLSKQTQKRFQQIEQRKLKETKLSGYLKVLEDNQIDQVQRELLYSTRDIGQKQSQKELLRRLFKKHKAGMQLTDDENEILFPNGERPDAVLMEQDLGSTLTAEAPLPQVLTDCNSLELIGNKEETEVDILAIVGGGSRRKPISKINAEPIKGMEVKISLLTDASDSKLMDTHKTETGNTSDNLLNEEQPVPVASSGIGKLSIGATLKQQMARLKEEAKSSALSANTLTLEQPSTGDNFAGEINISIEPQKIYVPEPIALPAMTGNDPDVSRANIPRRNAKIVTIRRDAAIQAARMCLPVCGMEQEIVELVNENDVIILCGETGSGKSTQVPQFLYESGYGRTGIIGITQPRRVAATSTAVRVAQEMGDRLLHHIGDIDGKKSLRRKHASLSKSENPEIRLQCNHSETQPGSENFLGKSNVDRSSISRRRLPLRLFPFGTARVKRIPKSRLPLRVAARSFHSIAQDSSISSLKPFNLNDPPCSDQIVSTEDNSIETGTSDGIVSYQVRFDSTTVRDSTKILFMTDGILLREITEDLLLRKYSVVILDEAHERNVNTDILLGMLSRAVPLRRSLSEEEKAKWATVPLGERHLYEEPIAPLKLIIMSATLRIEDFKNPVLFPVTPPVINVESRQYPVVTHFAKHTELTNYLQEAYRKVCQIHRKLPPGGILVFLTGKREIHHMCRKLHKALRSREFASGSDNNTPVGANYKSQEDESSSTFDIDADMLEADDDFAEIKKDLSPNESIEVSWDPESDGEDSVVFSDDEDYNDDSIQLGFSAAVSDSTARAPKTNKLAEDTEIRHSESNDADIRQKMLAEALGVSVISLATADPSLVPPSAELNPLSEPALKAIILPLSAMMSPAQQAKVFREQPPGTRLIVVATNVAETSITIPGIRYVVDCGRQKSKILQTSTGICKYDVQWISKTSAEQRKGRAGRTGPGHCYRLYSSAFYDQQMEQHQAPAILSTPLEDLLLQMKAMRINNIESFPFPTAPSSLALRKAQTLLLHLGALETHSIRSINSLDLLHNYTRYKEILRDAKSTLEQDSVALVTNSRSDPLLSSKTSIVDLVRNVIASQNTGSVITEMGTLMARFPINPRFAKMLILAYQTVRNQSIELAPEQLYASRLVQLVIGLIGCLAEKSPFLSLGNKSQDEFLGSDDESSGHDEDDNEGDSLLWFHREGDALARLCALGASAHVRLTSQPRRTTSTSTTLPTSQFTKLCAQHSLHESTLTRSLDLSTQLKQVVGKLFTEHNLRPEKVSGRIGDKVSWQVAEPPNAAETVMLRQIMMASYCDCIAKRAPVGTVKIGSRRRRLTAYFSCNPAITEPIYIHPHSNLYRKDPTANHPEYVLYTDLIRNATGDCTYMSCVTAVNGAWIPHVVTSSTMVSFSSPLESPSPYYDHSSDCVMCYVVPVYGVHKWEFPALKRPMVAAVVEGNELDKGDKTAIGYRKQDAVYRWFARLLLEGAILQGPNFRKIWDRKNLKESPVIITSQHPAPYVSQLLQMLVSHNVKSLGALKETCRTTPTFLEKELEKFFQIDARKAFRKAWAFAGAN